MTKHLLPGHRKKYVLIVDAYSTGQYLADRFKKEGFECLHMQSQQEIPHIVKPSFVPEAFEANIIYEGIEPTLRKLKLYRVVHVVAGCEMGVSLADQLANTLSLPGNKLESSASRFNKYEMIKSISEKGLRSAQYIASSNLEDIKLWAKKNDLQKTVLKPLQSAGNDHVYICENQIEVVDAFHQIMSSENLFNQPNHTVLAQSFLCGQEYIVNCVSWNGKHRVTDVWACHKKMLPGHGALSCLESLVNPNEDFFSELVAYAFDILDAVGIRYGAGHLEIMLTEKGPILIEVAARLQGCVDPTAVELGVGSSQLSQLVLAYSTPESFVASSSYTVRQFIYRVFMLSPSSGMLENTLKIKKLQKMESFFSYTGSLKKGVPISKTTDISTTCGYMHWLHKNPSQLIKDYDDYRSMESGMISTLLQKKS